jgi:hypothetical protein
LVNSLSFQKSRTPSSWEKTLLATRGILAEIALLALGCSAAFDDLIAMTVTASYRD